MPRSPTPPIVSAAGFASTRRFAESLIKKYSEFELLGKGEGARSTLQINLGKLFKGQDLVWWRNRRHLAVLVADALDVAESSLGLDQDLVQHRFVFETFPELQQLNLVSEDRYVIARPKIVSEHLESAPAWKNMHYWLLGDGTVPSPQYLDWLQVEDPTEFKLITAHLAATSRHTILQINAAAEPGGADSDMLRHHSPLILVVTEPIGVEALQMLRLRAQMAPLLVVSPYTLAVEDFSFKRKDGSTSSGTGQVNMWRWTLDDNWRASLIHWVQLRLARNALAANFDADALVLWFARADPEQHWFPQVADVLQVCRIAFHKSEKSLSDILLDRRLIPGIFHITPDQYVALEDAVLRRWCCWETPWETELPYEAWLAAKLSARRLNKLLKTGFLCQGSSGYQFSDRVLSRMLLRKVIDKQVRTQPPETWWPACFDQERRALLDATLGTMSLTGLKQACQHLARDVNDRAHLLGPAESLAVEIGRRLAKGLCLDRDLTRVGALVFQRDDQDANDLPPFSRPVSTLNQAFQWRATRWVWTLAGASLAHGTRQSPPELAGDGQVGHKQEWLVVRAGYADGRLNVPRGATLEYLMDVTALWSASLSKPPDALVPALLRPALVQRAIDQSWPVDIFWWTGLIGQDWAESALVRMLDGFDEERRCHAAQQLWPSLVAWQDYQCKESRQPFIPAKERMLPSCRAQDQQYSPVMEWVACQLSGIQVMATLRPALQRFLQSHPQWLFSHHKLVVLEFLASRLPLKLAVFERWGYFSAFLPDAAEGLLKFLADDELGEEAAAGLWNWASSHALSILEQDSPELHRAASKLVLTCPRNHLHVAIAALHRQPNLLSEQSRKQWARSQLPSAGPLARVLFSLI